VSRPIGGVYVFGDALVVRVLEFLVGENPVQAGLARWLAADRAADSRYHVGLGRLGVEYLGYLAGKDGLLAAIIADCNIGLGAISGGSDAGHNPGEFQGVADGVAGLGSHCESRFKIQAVRMVRPVTFAISFHPTGIALNVFQSSSQLI